MEKSRTLVVSLTVALGLAVQVASAQALVGREANVAAQAAAVAAQAAAAGVTVPVDIKVQRSGSNTIEVKAIDSRIETSGGVITTTQTVGGDTVRVESATTTTGASTITSGGSTVTAVPAGTGTLNVPMPRLPEAMRAPDLLNNAVAQPVDPTYEIGPEDILFIRVWREADLSGQFAVRPDGKITFPLIGDIKAGGLTPSALQANLVVAMMDYIIKPEIMVSVLQVNSKKYSISGEVNRPGTYPLVLPTRVFEALSAAGGFREFAKKSGIIIMRGKERKKFNYDDVIRGKHLERNILLENGDTIIVN